MSETQASEALRQFTAAMRGLAQAAKRTAALIQAAFRPVIRGVERPQHIARFGPHNVDADGFWITDLCASWLHGSCQSPRYCDCRCHGTGR